MICLLAAPWVCSTVHCPLTAVSQLLLVRLSNASLLVISLVSSSLCLRFKGHCPAGPTLASTGMSPFWILLVLTMMEVVSHHSPPPSSSAPTTGSRRSAKLQSNHHHKQTNTQLFTGLMPFLSPNQQSRSTERKPSKQLCSKY